jgi:hypothetical protein
MMVLMLLLLSGLGIEDARRLAVFVLRQSMHYWLEPDESMERRKEEIVAVASQSRSQLKLPCVTSYLLFCCSSVAQVAQLSMHKAFVWVR